MMWLCTHSKKKQLRRKTHTQISMPDWVHNCCYPSTIIFVLLLCVVRVRNEQFSIFSLLIPSSSLVLIHSLSLTRYLFDICLVFECVFFATEFHSVLCIRFYAVFVRCQLSCLISSLWLCGASELCIVCCVCAMCVLSIHTHLYTFFIFIMSFLFVLLINFWMLMMKLNDLIQFY